MLFLNRKRRKYSKLIEDGVIIVRPSCEKEEGALNVAFSGSLDNVGLAPIHYVAREGDKCGLKQIIKSGDISLLQLRATCGSIAAHFAAQHGQTEILAWIVRYDESSLEQTDEKGNTPLLVAVEHGQYETVKYLVRQTSADPYHTNYRGQNGAHVACDNNNLGCLQVLVSVGCSLVINDYLGYTPLHLVAKQGHTAIARWLLTQTQVTGLERDDMGSTALHVACEYGHEELIRLFIRSGIPLTCEDGECRTPEMLAEMYQQENCLRVIEEERRRRLLLEDSGPYTGSLQRRDKRRRQDHRHSQIPHVYDNTGYYPSNQDSVIFASSNSLASANCTLRRANTICSADPTSYLRNRCNRESIMSQGSEFSYKRHSKSTFDSGFESGLSDILDEILGAAVYDPVLEGDESPKTKWQSFKEKLTDAFVKAKNKDIPDNVSDTSDIKTTRWRKVQKFVKVKLARISQQDIDMGGFEDDHWRSLEPRQFHRGTRRTQSMVRWKNRREE